MRARCGWRVGGRLLLVLAAGCGGAKASPVQSAEPPAAQAAPLAPREAHGPAPSFPGREDAAPDDQCDGDGLLVIERSDEAEAFSTGARKDMDAGGGLSVATRFMARHGEVAPLTFTLLLDDSRDNRSANYRATWQEGVIRVRPDPTTPPDIAEDARRARFLSAPDYARRLRSVAAALLGWPGEAIRGAAVPGQTVSDLGGPLKTILDLRERGQSLPTATTAVFRGRVREAWGEALVFDVTVGTASADQATRRGRLGGALGRGELVARARDGAFVALRVDGTLHFELAWACTPAPVPATNDG